MSLPVGSIRFQSPREDRLAVVSSQLGISSKDLLSMIKNGAKAIFERDSGISLEDAQRIFPWEQISGGSDLERRLPYSSFEFAQQGNKGRMEDAHFICETSGGTLLGVFDGHRGSQVALYAKRAFEREFSQELDRANKNVRRAFISLIEKIQSEVEQIKEGSTAVICFVLGSLIYTATLGDSEAKIYRQDQEIPLSCLRNWATPKEAERAAQVMKGCHGKKERVDKIRATWPNHKDPKLCRYPHLSSGLNLSRALGDADHSPALSHKPKITIQKIIPGDIVVVASDGLWDVAKKEEIWLLLKRNDPDQDLARSIARYAINKEFRDDVTVLVLAF